MHYFKLSDDVHVPGRWELGAPLDSRGQKIWTWIFRRGEPITAPGTIQIPQTRSGKPLDFSVAGAAVPIVHRKVATLFSQLAPQDVQLIPVAVDSQTEEYFALNTLRSMKCIDDAACEEVQYWTPDDGQPDLVGEYRAVAGLRIDPTKVADAKVFRPLGWPVVLIVSEELKTALEQLGITGVKFVDVTGPRHTEEEKSSSMQKHADLHRRIDAAREAAYHSLGDLEEESLIPIVMGGPLWPGQRQAWRVIHRPNGHTLLATDGMSDPFIDQEEPSAGFGLELLIETNEPVESARGSWLLQLLQRVGDEVAEHEHLRTWLFDRYISMEVSGENMPKTLVTSEERVAVLLGVESKNLPRGFITPAGEVRLITVKALLPTELTHLLELGRGGAAELAKLFAKSGQEHLSGVNRRPVA